jgi:hypothetical protein
MLHNPFTYRYMITQKLNSKNTEGIQNIPYAFSRDRVAILSILMLRVILLLGLLAMYTVSWCCKLFRTPGICSLVKGFVGSKFITASSRYLKTNEMSDTFLFMKVLKHSWQVICFSDGVV